MCPKPGCTRSKSASLQLRALAGQALGKPLAERYIPWASTAAQRKICPEGLCRAYAAYSCPAALPNKGLPSLFLILKRSNLHAHPRESISGLTAAFSSCLIGTPHVHAQIGAAHGIHLPLRPLPSRRHSTRSLSPSSLGCGCLWGGCSVSSFASSSKKINK